MSSVTELPLLPVYLDETVYSVLNTIHLSQAKATLHCMACTSYVLSFSGLIFCFNVIITLTWIQQFYSVIAEILGGDSPTWAGNQKMQGADDTITEQVVWLW